MSVDISEMKQFFDDMKSTIHEFKQDVYKHLDSVGVRFLNYCQDAVREYNIIDTSRLLHSLQNGNNDNIYEWSDGNVKLTVGTAVEYAGYVNDGHWMCSQGEVGRFVPGVWKGNGKFEYQPGAKTGMYVKQQYIGARPFFDIGFERVSREYDEEMSLALTDWINKFT